MIEMTVRLYATLKDQVGRPRVTVDIPENADVSILLKRLGEVYPPLEAGLGSAVVSVNRAFAEPETPVQAGDEVAIFPPVSGGSETDYPTFFSITSDPLDLNQIHDALTRDDVGAIITFTGKVRGATKRSGLPTETTLLEYEAYEEMAVEKLKKIAAEIWEKWDMVKGIAIVQRIGTLEVGEVTTLVACAAGHRDQGAFEACRYGIDRLKEIVPVWKKEVGPNRSVWIEGAYRPTSADN